MSDPPTWPTPAEQPDAFLRLPGLFRRWEVEQVLDAGHDFHIEDPWKHRLATLPHRFAGGAAVSVLVGEADAGFRWGLDLEHSADGGRTWTGHSTCFSNQSGAAAASFDSWPETGSLRLVVKATDANAAGRVWGALSITVR